MARQELWSGSKVPETQVIVLDTMMEYNTSSNSQQLPQELGAAFQQMFPDTFRSISLDSFRGDFLVIVYRSFPDVGLAQSLSKSWAAEGNPKFQFKSFPLPFNSTESSKLDIGNFWRSDHRNFWMNNISAIFLTDSANFRGDMIKCYLHPSDNLAIMLTEDNIQILAKPLNGLSVPLEQGTSSSSTRIMYSFIVPFVTLLCFFISLQRDMCVLSKRIHMT